MKNEMPLLICTATAAEMSALAGDIFPRPELIPEMRPIVSEWQGYKNIFLVTGPGPINAALAIGYCLGLYHNSSQDTKISALCYMGLAGAFNLESDPLCSIRVVRREIWPEYGLHDGTSVTARAFRFPLWKMENGEAVYDSVALAGLDSIGASLQKDWRECASLTVAGVSASFTRRDRLWNAWQVELENMEGFAAAYAAMRAGLPCVEIRVVSNKVGPRGRNEKDFEGALATLATILPALNLIK